MNEPSDNAVRRAKQTLDAHFGMGLDQAHEAIRTNPATAAIYDCAIRAIAMQSASTVYNPARAKYAAPGDQQEDVWLLRFNDQDMREAIWTGPDAEAEAWAAWEKYAPAWNCYVFRLATIPAPTPPSEGAADWRCFHCGEVFTDRSCAQLHFGRNEDSEPACIIKAGAEGSILRALRRAEEQADDAVKAMHAESTDAAKAYHGAVARHAQALIAAEELGYERGLSDGQALATPPAPDSALVAKLNDLWKRVSDALDDIPGGMHASLEDAASDLADAFDAALASRGAA